MKSNTVSQKPRYVTKAADCCGVFYESDESPDLATAIAAAVAVQARQPKAWIIVANLNEADIDCHDGLTEDEREVVEEALQIAETV